MERERDLAPSRVDRGGLGGWGAPSLPAQGTFRPYLNIGAPSSIIHDRISLEKPNAISHWVSQTSLDAVFLMGSEPDGAGGAVPRKSSSSTEFMYLMPSFSWRFQPPGLSWLTDLLAVGIR